MKLAEALYRHGDTCMLRIELIIPKMCIGAFAVDDPPWRQMLGHG